jgi:hypothetical protein
MSRQRTVTPVLSAVALTLLSGSATARDFPAAAELERESSSTPQLIRQFKGAELLCALCELKVREDGSPPPGMNTPMDRSYALLKAESGWPLISAGGDSRSARAFGGLQFRDNQPLVNRLKRVQSWPLFTIWDSRAATLYVGVNRDGEPGVHLRQKRHDRGSLVPPNRVLIASSSLPAESRSATPRR